MRLYIIQNFKHKVKEDRNSFCYYSGSQTVSRRIYSIKNISIKLEFLWFISDNNEIRTICNAESVASTISTIHNEYKTNTKYEQSLTMNYGKNVIFRDTLVYKRMLEIFHILERSKHSKFSKFMTTLNQIDKRKKEKTPWLKRIQEFDNVTKLLLGLYNANKNI